MEWLSTMLSTRGPNFRIGSGLMVLLSFLPRLVFLQTLGACGLGHSDSAWEAYFFDRCHGGGSNTTVTIRSWRRE